MPLALMGLVFGLAACNNAGPKSQSNESTPAAESQGKQEKITITAADGKTKLILGEKVQLTASVEGVTWESDHPEVATVSASGLVESKSAGSVKITAKKDGYKEGTISIKVDLETIKVTAANDKTELLANETVQLSADKDGVTWKTSDESVATVSDKGLVTAIKFGTVTITAEKEGFNAGKITINVVRPAASAAFDLTTAADHYSADGWWELPSAGGFSFAMQTVTGWNPISQQSSWGQQSEEPVETFVGGFGVGDKETVKFTSSKAGKAEIVVNLGNSSAVTLSEIMTVKLNDAAINIGEIALEEHAGQWGNDLVFADISFGEANIVSGENTLVFEFLADTNIFLNEVTLYAGDATVALVNPAEKVQIAVTSEELSVIEGETVQIETAVEGVSYVSVDAEIASVDEKGVVTGVKVGKTNITVKKEGMYSIRVEITVNPKPVEGQLLIEAESAEELKDVQPGGFNQGSPNIMQDGGMMGGSAVHSGGAYVTMWGGDSLTLTFKFNVDEAKTMVLSVVGSAPMSMGGEAAAYVLSESMVVKMNDTAVTPVEGAQFPAPQGYMAEMAEAVIGDVQLIKGENTLVVEMTGSIPSLDVFKLSVKA